MAQPQRIEMARVHTKDKRRPVAKATGRMPKFAQIWSAIYRREEIVLSEPGESAFLPANVWSGRHRFCAERALSIFRPHQFPKVSTELRRMQYTRLAAIVIASSATYAEVRANWAAALGSATIGRTRWRGATREQIAEVLGVAVSVNASAAVVYSTRTSDAFYAAADFRPDT
jgi:hypothetical protein